MLRRDVAWLVSLVAMCPGGCDRGETVDAPTRVTPSSSFIEATVPGVACTLALVKCGGDVIAHIDFVNESDETVGIQPWDLFNEGHMTTSRFLIIQDGMEVVYRCMMAKRRAPTWEELIHLGPGETTQVQINMADCYDLKPPGAYRVQYACVGNLRRAEVIMIASNIVTLEMP